MTPPHPSSSPDHDAAERFFELSVDMLTFADFTGYFRRLSPSWERTLGWSLAHLTSRPMIEFVHPDDRERTLAKNRDVWAGGAALSFENRYLCRDGSYKWLLWNAVADVEQQVIYSIARDITDRKAAEAERERLVGELQAALAEVRQLQEILPICSYCRKVRDPEDFWHSVEDYIAHHTDSRFSHGICPECYTTTVEPMLDESERR
jgi:PAS domain S-box-containing protein